MLYPCKSIDDEKCWRLSTRRFVLVFTEDRAAGLANPGLNISRASIRASRAATNSEPGLAKALQSSIVKTVDRCDTRR